MKALKNVEDYPVLTVQRWSVSCVNLAPKYYINDHFLLKLTLMLLLSVPSYF
jgi:hypothetical protein